MLEKLFTQHGLVRDPLSEAELNAKWGSGFKLLLGNMTGKGLSPVPNNALLFNTVYACINVLSDDIAKLPFNVFQKKDSVISRQTNIKAHHLLRVRPNEWMSPFDLIKLIVTDVCIYGNSYTRIEITNDGDLLRLAPLSAEMTMPVFDKTTKTLWYVTTINNQRVVLHNQEVVHIKGVSRDGIVGMSPLDSMRIQLESNDRASRYNLNMIESGATPQGILKTDAALNEQAREKVREGWEATNNGKQIAIVSNGLEYQQIGISQADMQWLEAQRFNQQQIAAIYKVPLHKINDLQNATYTNIEHQSLDYVKNTLQPWVTKIEQEFNFKLFTPSEVQQGYYTKFNMDSELRGDSKARAQVNEINIRNGFKTINEVRELNEDSPYDGEFASVPWITLNYVPAENAERYQQNKFGQTLREGGDEGEETA